MCWVCFTDSTCVHTSMWTGRNDPMSASGSLKHKKPLCIISWGGGRERRGGGGVFSWGRGQWPSSQPFRWPNSQQHRNPLSPPTVLYHIHHPPLTRQCCLPLSFQRTQSINWAGMRLMLTNPFINTAHSLLPAMCGLFMPVFPLSHTLLKSLFFFHQLKPNHTKPPIVSAL